MSAPRARPRLLALALMAGCAARARPSTPAAPPAGPALTVLDTRARRAPVRPAAEEEDGASDIAARATREAMSAVEARDYATAARHFEAAYNAVHSIELAFNTARMYERLADVPQATRWYETVLAGTPSDTLRAEVNRRLALLRAYAQRRRDDIAQPPPDAEALAREASRWFRRGVTFYQRRRYAAALRAFEAANQYVQGDRVPELMFNLGMTHARLGHNAEAVSAFRAYLAARPDAPERADLEARIRALSP